MSQTLIKAAFAVSYADEPEPGIIVFQLNPESINRLILPPQSNTGHPESGEVRERISFVLSVDSKLGDDFFIQNEGAVSNGVLSFLSAIELLVYPVDVIGGLSARYQSRRLSGMVNFIVNVFRKKPGYPLPLVNLLLGEQRVIPVKIKSVQITEQAFDSKLQPVRASIKIVMDSISSRESKQHPKLRETWKNYLRLKTSLAGGVRSR